MKTRNGHSSNFVSRKISSDFLCFTGESIVVSTIRIITVFFLLFFSLSGPLTLFAAGNNQIKPPQVQLPELNSASGLQERYNALTAPGIVMLPATGTSSVPRDIVARIEGELLRQFIYTGKLKPVRMQRWLLSTYTNKANNPFVVMNAIREEQFVFPLQYLGKPIIFKNDKKYYFALYVYALETYYPITVFRQIASLNTIDKMISSCIEELDARLSHPVSGITRKRIVVDDFKLDFYRMVEHSSGEFEFISVPFIERDGMTMREGDDFFSRMMGYILETTNLFQVIQTGDFKEYSNANISASSNMADYRIQGRAQLSDYECVLYIDVINLRSGVRVISLRYPMLSYSFDRVWDAYRRLSVQIVESVFDRDTYGVVPTLTAPNRSFFANNMFVGRNTLENFILERGLNVISTGSQFRVENAAGAVNSYYILLDDHPVVFTDKEGRRIWNLLRK
jgi:hypothetical protein